MTVEDRETVNGGERKSGIKKGKEKTGKGQRDKD